MGNRSLDVLKETWPDWEIVSEIGEGAFGTVYRAVRRDMAGSAESAIKVIVIPKMMRNLKISVQKDIPGNRLACTISRSCRIMRRKSG